MDILTPQTFFMWCTIMDGGLLALWITLWTFAPDMVHRMQHK